MLKVDEILCNDVVVRPEAEADSIFVSVSCCKE